MRKAEKLFRYIFLMIVIFGILIVMNVVMYSIPALSTDNRYHYKSRLSELETSLHKVNGNYQIDKEIEAALKKQKEWAMLINEQGKVVWSSQLPEEIPREYSLKEVASFTRWYLKGYPVFTKIIDEGILVNGVPKGSVWKYVLVEDMNEFKMKLKHLPYIIIIDIFALIFLPFCILRHRMKKEEYERIEWIAGVSHDIRTPLSLILGNADRMNYSRLEIPDEIRRDIYTIKNQALYIKDLVANLNTENRLSYGAGQWKKDKVLLADLIRDVFCDILNQNENSLYDVSCEIEASLETLCINADENLIRRMLENLLGNTIRHNPEGCSICVKLIPSQKCIIKRRYRLIVEDNGKGADEKTLKRINRNSQKNKIAEHGLGLRVVKQIVKLYHWKIKFLSKQGEGFKCEIELK